MAIWGRETTCVTATGQKEEVYVIGSHKNIVMKGKKEKKACSLKRLYQV